MAVSLVKKFNANVSFQCLLLKDIMPVSLVKTFNACVEQDWVVEQGQVVEHGH